MPPLSSPIRTNARPLRVMIVDDMPQVRRDLGLLLQLSGEVEIIGEATNGAEAVQQAAAVHPEVILMDLVMPGMDGFEAARQILNTTADCRVIALSIHGDSVARQQALLSGMTGFLIKGTPLVEILRTLANAGPVNIK